MGPGVALKVEPGAAAGAGRGGGRGGGDLDSANDRAPQLLVVPEVVQVPPGELVQQNMINWSHLFVLQ